MNDVYPARYKDFFGEEQTTIHNDGETLTIVVRGVKFQGHDFDCLQPKDVSEPARLESFTLLHGLLRICTIEADIPIPVVTPSGIVDGLLTFELELRKQLPTGQTDRERLKLRLVVNDHTFYSKGKAGLFEGEMRDLQCELPVGTFMKVCFNCALSDYSPYGHGSFGSMICFKSNKAGYLGMPYGDDFDKDAYFEVLDTVRETVQETYLCPEFVERLPGTGYRG